MVNTKNKFGKVGNLDGHDDTAEFEKSWLRLQGYPKDFINNLQ